MNGGSDRRADSTDRFYARAFVPNERRFLPSQPSVQSARPISRSNRGKSQLWLIIFHEFSVRKR